MKNEKQGRRKMTNVPKGMPMAKNEKNAEFRITNRE